MKVTELYIYPIKALYPLSVRRTRLRREGLEHDRRFMLLKVLGDGTYQNIQTAFFPECTLFRQAIEKDDDDDNEDDDNDNGDGSGQSIVVTYSIPAVPLIDPPPPEQRTQLRVPLRPDVAGLATVDVRLYGSPTAAYRMGEPYDGWFSACLGYEVVLVYIGDQGREVLAHSPNNHGEDNDNPQRQQQKQQKQGSWFSSITSYITGSGAGGLQPGVDDGQEKGKDDKSKNKKRGDWLTFNEAAPFLLTSKASLRDVSARLPEGEAMDMIRFRPNIVVDDDDNDDDSSNDSDNPDNPDNPHGSTDTYESRSSAPSSAPSSSPSTVEEDNDDDDDEKAIRKPLQAWEEDFWAELELRRCEGDDEKQKKDNRINQRRRRRNRDRDSRHPRLALTANCARCISININYDTGHPAAGEQGTVLKKLMRDRRVDRGNKWSPVFGRYAFLMLPPSLSSSSSSPPPSSSGPRRRRRGDEGEGELVTTAAASGEEEEYEDDEYDVYDVYDEEEESGDDSDDDNDSDLAVAISVGDEVTVTRRISDRDVWSWPTT
ncbi:hypothetical protein F5X99DRAFT_374009 [Biscogniauxia marginata]|nr:hypothetical protein F5X99DRAFT_374009 [Biscogniauxia marginata]